MCRPKHRFWVSMEMRQQTALLRLNSTQLDHHVMTKPPADQPINHSQEIDSYYKSEY